MSNEPSASSVCTESPLFAPSLRVSSSTSRTAPVDVYCFLPQRRFLDQVADATDDVASAITDLGIRPSACRTSSRSEGRAIGCLTSWATEEVTCPVVTRIVRASSICFSCKLSILTIVSHDLEKRVIGLDDATIKVPDEDAYDVCVDQVPDLRFAFCEVAV